MAEFGYILIILIEIITAAVIVACLLETEKKVTATLGCAIQEGEELIIKLRRYKEDLKAINDVFSLIKRVDFRAIKKGITNTIEIINFILLIRSFNTKGGLKLAKALKLLPFSFIRKIISSFKV